MIPDGDDLYRSKRLNGKVALDDRFSHDYEMFQKALLLLCTSLLIVGEAAENDSRWDDQFGPPSEASLNVTVNGANGLVRVIETFGTNTYVGGRFTRIGNIQANNIARWDGSRWHTLGEGTTNGVSGEVNAIASWQGKICVGGLFDRAGGVEVSNLAWWSEENGWTMLGGKLNDRVRALQMTTDTGELYVGGDFTGIAGENYAFVARLNHDGAVRGLESGVNAPVHALAVGDSAIWLGGEFTEAGGREANHLAEWDTLGEDAGWARMPGVDGFVYALRVYGNNLLVGGNFTSTTDGVPSRSFAIYERDRFRFVATDALLHGPLPVVVNAIESDGRGIHIGGHFRGVTSSRTAATILAGNLVVRYSNGSWANPFGTGFNGEVFALGGRQNLVVGGAFNEANGQPADNIAAVRNTEVQVLTGNAGPVARATAIRGMGLDQRVLALASKGPYVYAGGGFTNAGGVLAERVARWDGERWRPLGAIANGHVRALLPVDGGLFAAGEFSEANGPVENIAFWNGTRWSALGPVITNVVVTPFGTITSYEINGPEGVVRGLATIGSNLYAVGSFGGVGKCVAKWNGTTWTNLAEGSAQSGGSHDSGGGLRPEGLGNMTEFGVSSADAYAVVALDGQLYVGGWFNRAGTNVVKNVARWDGEHWHPVGEGFNGEVHAMVTDGVRIYAGGTTATEVGALVQNVGVWNGTTWTMLPGEFDGPVHAMVLRGNNLYVTGGFTNITGVKMSGTARWDGTRWNPLGSGLQYFDDYEAVGRAIILRDEGVYIGGDFSKAGGKPSFHLARWSLDGGDNAEWRTVYFSTNDQALSLDDADPDGDGMNNAQEFAAGTNPRAAESVFSVEPTVLELGTVTVTFVAEANRSYSVQYSDSAEMPLLWQRLADVGTLGVRRAETLVDDTAPPRFRFYRVVTPALP